MEQNIPPTLRDAVQAIQDQANDPKSTLGKLAQGLRQGLKGAWEVQAGLHPDHTIEELTRTFPYTSKAYGEDLQVPPHLPTQFSRLSTEAHEYARTLEDPGKVNSVRVAWNWF